MTPRQKEAFFRFIKKDSSGEFHHGDCIGADFDAHQIVSKINKHRIVIHPCDIVYMRAFCVGDEILKPRKPLTRNEIMVDLCEILFATPGEFLEKQRGGTWFTIRYARKTSKPLIIIFPDGSTIQENFQKI